MSRHTDELLESALHFAHDYYTRNEEMLPQLLFEDADGTPVVVVFPFTNDVEKEASLGLLRGMLYAHGATSYTVMTEGWVGSHTSEAEKAKAPRPSLDPNRKEVLTVLVVTRSGDRTGVLYEIQREPGGKVTNLIDTGGGVTGGVFSELFEGPAP